MFLGDALHGINWAQLRDLEFYVVSESLDAFWLYFSSVPESSERRSPLHVKRGYLQNSVGEGSV